MALGFFGLTGAIAVAHFSPATGYELSVYGATPVPYWGGVGLALLLWVICLVRWSGRDRVLARAGGLLLGLAILSVAGLPVIRGYYFYGQFDPLTQLGLAHQVYHASSEVFVYPFYHSLSVEIASVAGLPIRQGLLLSLVLGLGLYAAAVPFAASRLSPSGRGVRQIALAVAFVGVPLMTVRLPQFAPIPNTMAALFWPLGFACYLAWYQTRELNWGLVTLGVAGATVFVHPTAAVALSLLLVATALSTLLVNAGEVRTWDSVVPVPFAIGILSFVWISAFQTKLSDFLLDWQMDASGVGSDVIREGESLSQIGVSLFELFMKIVFVKLLLVALGGLLCLWLLVEVVRRSERIGRRERLTVAFGIGLVPIGCLILAFFVLGISNQYSRYVGLAMGPTAVLAAIALDRGLGRLGSSVPGGSRAARTGVGAVVVVALLLSSMMIIHASPWVVRPTKHVTQQQMTGYETSIQHGGEGIRFAGVYSQPRRTLNAYYGARPSGGVGTNRTWERDGGRLPQRFADRNVDDDVETPVYVVSTEYDRRVHLELFEEMVYSRLDFEWLRNNDRADRVYHNGEFELYLYG